jgi:hypothetical protein
MYYSQLQYMYYSQLQYMYYSQLQYMYYFQLPMQSVPIFFNKYAAELMRDASVVW